MGWAAAGLGIITKGVGFLPLLLLLPAMVLRARQWSPIASVTLRQWLLGVLALLVAVGLWLVPLLLAARGNPQLQAYRDEILFRQTIDRYASAWQHREPFWYFIVNVIPLLWLPFSALLPWLVPRWRDAWRARDPRSVLPLLWIALVVLFFSCSSGKRGVYVLPALPALALAAAPYLRDLLMQRAAQRVLYGQAVLISVVCVLASLLLLIAPEQRAAVSTDYGLDPFGPVLLLSVMTAAVCAWSRAALAPVAFAAVLTTVLLVVSYWLNPQMNAVRSSATFIQRIEQHLGPGQELGFFSFREQYLLTLRRPVTHFGHEVWRAGMPAGQQEIADAAFWLAGSPTRVMVINEWGRQHCFASSRVTPLGVANRRTWYLVHHGSGDPECIARGTPLGAIHYVPPAAAAH
jgi:4-amino-4-deoxy-L-arabinose transferase-like glycosyltransferase